MLHLHPTPLHKGGADQGPDPMLELYCWAARLFCPIAVLFTYLIPAHRPTTRYRQTPYPAHVLTVDYCPMSKPRKGLRPARVNTASAVKRKSKPSWASFFWHSTWVRVLLIFAVASLPLLAAVFAGPTIRGSNDWRGTLQGVISGGRKSDGGGPGSGSGSGGGDSASDVGGLADFGPVSVRLFNPVTRSRLQADFQLEGISVINDGPELEKIVKNKYRFIREQATIAVRNCSNAELADPKLKMLERRVLIRINRSLERPLLKSVDLAKFSLCEATPELDLMGDDEDEDLSQ